MASFAAVSPAALSSRAAAGAPLRKNNKAGAGRRAAAAAPPRAQSQDTSNLGRNLRVTRLRDLVDVSPEAWIDPNAKGAQIAANEQDVFLTGLAQGSIFKELLLASHHFRVYSYEVLPTGQHSVRFMMGSPRMEGLDDVSRVTRLVCEKDLGLLNLVHDHGANTEVAEIVFPLPALETPAPSSASIDPEVLRAERLDALVQALEAQVIDESVVCLMEKGSDDRSTFHGTDRLNKYFTGMFARPDYLLHRGTCTSSSPTPGALDAARDMLIRLWNGDVNDEDVDLALVDDVRARVEALFCGGEGRMVVHPSGTDAETTPLLQAILQSRELARANGGDKGKVTSLVCCAGEVGSGTTEACQAAFFSKSVPLGGNKVRMGQELPKMHALCDMEAIELVARADDGTGSARADYDDLVEMHARNALAADPAAVVVVHTIAGSKTGLCLPSPAVAERLKAEFGTRVVSVLDACQMRNHPDLFPRWLKSQGPILMTSSKFYGGPSFGSGVFIPHGDVAAMNRQLAEERPEIVAAIAEGLASYLTFHDIGDVLPTLRDAMPPGFCNAGVLLRWAAGLHEMENLARAGDVDQAAHSVRAWVHEMRREAQTFGPYLEYVPAVDYEGDWQLGGVNTIIALRLRSGDGEECLSTADLKKVYAMMHADISDYLAPGSSLAERRVAAQRCLLGQPVDIPAGAVLRSCLGAAQLADLVAGRQSLDDMLEDDRVLLAKLALVARQFDHLLSHHL